MWHGSQINPPHTIHGLCLIFFKSFLSTILFLVYTFPMQDLIIVGAGGFAREVFAWVPKHAYNVVAFYTHDADHRRLLDVPVISEIKSQRHLSSKFIIAIGDPKNRAKMWEEIQYAGLDPATIVHPSAIIGHQIDIGAGSIICPGVVLTTNVRIGRGVILNLNSTVGHDCSIDNFVTVSPGANISGNVHLHEFSYVGTNAAIREKVMLGSNSVLGMGAVLTKDLPSGETWCGNPAKKLYRYY